MTTATQPPWLAKGLKASEHAAAGRSTVAARASEAAETTRRDALARRYVRHVAWDLRFAMWLRSWIVTAADFDRDNLRWIRWRRIKIKLASLYPNLRGFVAAVCGPRVPEDVRQRRSLACEGCSALRVRLPKREGGRLRKYCGACGCPDWPLSELPFKNKLERHVCPTGAQPPRPDWVDEFIKQQEGA